MKHMLCIFEGEIMRKKRDIPSESQLELDFGDFVSVAECKSKDRSNVVKVQFGAPKNVPLAGSRHDQVWIERILHNAQRLKW